MKERELQEQIRTDINRTELFWAIIADVKPVWFNGRWIKNQATSGLSDIIVFCRKNNQVILIEVKRPKKKLNKNQLEFRRLCQMNNVIYHVVNDSLQALQALQYWCRRWGYRDKTLETILKQL